MSQPPVKKGFLRAQWSAGQLGFYKRFMLETQHHTRPMGSVRLWDKAVMFDISMRKGEGVYLSDFEALKPGRGDGGRGMAWFLGLADMFEMEVSLAVAPEVSDTNPLADEDLLQAWYARRGFVTAEGIKMLRPARPSF